MKSMINIGHDKGSVNAVADKVIELIKVSYDCRMEQETVRIALKAISDSLGSPNVSIADNNFINNPEKKAKG